VRRSFGADGVSQRRWLHLAGNSNSVCARSLESEECGGGAAELRGGRPSEIRLAAVGLELGGGKKADGGQRQLQRTTRRHAHARCTAGTHAVAMQWRKEQRRSGQEQ
jgi:hypothetical protein